MRFEFPVFDLMFSRGLVLLRSEKYKHLYCYSVFSSSGEISYLLSDSELSVSDIPSYYDDIFLIGEMRSERREK